MRLFLLVKRRYALITTGLILLTATFACQAQTSTWQETPQNVISTVQRPFANSCMQGPIAITSCFSMAVFASAFLILTIRRPDAITLDLVGKPVKSVIGAGGFLGLFFVFYLIAKLVMKGCS